MENDQYHRYICGIKHGCQIPDTDATGRWLIKSLSNPGKQLGAAQRLLSEYTVAELGRALYMRCRRVVRGGNDPIRSRVVPGGRPGRLREHERVEYRDRMIMQELKVIR